MSQIPAAPRIAPLEPPYDDDTEAQLAKWMPPGAAVEPLLLFRTLMVHRELAARMRPLGSALLGHGLVEARAREIMILRTCARCGAEYEWGVHAVAFGSAVGLSDGQIAASATGTSADPAWSDSDRTLVRLADELYETDGVSDRLWEQLASRWSAQQLLELITIAGWYRTISCIINAARIEREPWAASFPAQSSPHRCRLPKTT